MGCGSSKGNTKFVRNNSCTKKTTQLTDDNGIYRDFEIGFQKEKLGEAQGIESEFIDEQFKEIEQNDQFFRIVNTLRIKNIIEEYRENGDCDLVSRNKKELFKKNNFVL